MYSTHCTLRSAIVIDFQHINFNALVNRILQFIYLQHKNYGLFNVIMGIGTKIMGVGWGWGCKFIHMSIFISDKKRRSRTRIGSRNGGITADHSLNPHK